MNTPTLALTITPLRPRDVDTAAGLFARAFDHDPMAQLLHPDGEQRRRFQEDGGRTQIRRAMAYRHVFAAYEGEDVRGIAVWLPPGVTVRPSPPPLGALPRVVRALAQPGAIRLIRQRQRALAKAHRTPSWHLAFLATEPAHQGRGIGRRLLEHILERADADGTPVWLETWDPANVALYERFGFITTTHIEGVASLPTCWVMVRSARQDRT